jgi:alanyl-tRNA synthetase
MVDDSQVQIIATEFRNEPAHTSKELETTSKLVCRYLLRYGWTLEQKIWTGKEVMKLLDTSGVGYLITNKFIEEEMPKVAEEHTKRINDENSCCVLQ